MRKGTVTTYSRGVGIVTFDGGGTIRIHACGSHAELQPGDRVMVEGVDFPPRVFLLKDEPRREVPAQEPRPSVMATTDPRSSLQKAVDDLIDAKEDYES